MTIQLIEKAFRTAAGSNQNMSDGVGGTTSVQVLWTSGGTLIDSLADTIVNPLATPAWSLLSISITAGLQGAADAVGGKLGKIWAGLAHGVNATAGVVRGPVPSPTPDLAYILALPADTSIIDTLWDPAADAFPPSPTAYSPHPSPATAPVLTVACQISPPTPITIDPSIPLAVGMWLEPSLITTHNQDSSYVLTVLNARYSLVYDDGITPPAPGYS